MSEPPDRPPGEGTPGGETPPEPRDAESRQPPPPQASATADPGESPLGDPGETALDDPDLPLRFDTRASTEGDDDSGKRRWPLGPRGTLIFAAACAFVLVVAVGGTLSWLNSRDWYLVCHADTITAERGRLFPWGRSRLEAPQWKPIPIPPEFECADSTFATESELSEAFTRALLDEVGRRLKTGEAADVDVGDAQLQQALLLTRDRPAQRAAIETLQGSVDYWRGVSDVNAVIEQLRGASAHFESAADRGARNTDAREWASYTGALADELHQGPEDLRDASREVGPDEPPPFTGTAEAPAPDRDATTTDTPAAPLERDPVRDTQGTASDEPQAPATDDHEPVAPAGPDAGLPTGGVLL